VLSVADEGAGFDQGFLPHAFQRFSRDQGVHGGSGLGLAIVLAIAEAHGGSAIVLNTERGAEVSIQVPRTPPAQGAASAAAPGAAQTVPRAGHSS
jgi:signal transduction histidine kinase